MESFVQKHNFRASFFLFIIIRSDKCLDVSRRIVRAAYSRGVIVFFFTCRRVKVMRRSTLFLQMESRVFLIYRSGVDIICEKLTYVDL